MTERETHGGLSRRRVLQLPAAAGVAGVPALSTIATSTQAQQSSEVAWPVVRSDLANTGRTSVGAGPEALTRTWEASATGSLNPGHTIANGMAYYSSAEPGTGYVYAVDLTTGQRVWDTELEGIDWGDQEGTPMMRNTPVVEGDTVYAGITTGPPSSEATYQIYAIDAADGSIRTTITGTQAQPDSESSRGRPELTRAPFDSFRDPITPMDGVVYFSYHFGLLIALDVAAGEERWRVQNGQINAGVLTLDGQRVYAKGGDFWPAPNYYLRGIDRATGTVDWRVDDERITDLRPPPVLADGLLCATRNGSNTTSILVFDPDTGDLLKELSPSLGALSVPIVAGSQLFVGAPSGIYRIDPVAEVLEEVYAANWSSAPIVCAAGAHLYVASEAGVHVIDPAAGETRDEVSLAAPSSITPSAQHLLTTVDGQVHAYTPPYLDVSAPATARVAPGGSADITFTVENVGETTAGPVGLQLSGVVHNAGWTITGTDPAGGTWYDSDYWWERTDLAPGESRQPAAALSVPDDVQAGSYELDVAVGEYDTEFEAIDTATVTIEVDPLQGRADDKLALAGDLDSWSLSLEEPGLVTPQVNALVTAGQGEQLPRDRARAAIDRLVYGERTTALALQLTGPPSPPDDHPELDITREIVRLVYDIGVSVALSKLALKKRLARRLDVIDPAQFDNLDADDVDKLLELIDGLDFSAITRGLAGLMLPDDTVDDVVADCEAIAADVMADVDAGILQTGEEITQAIEAAYDDLLETSAAPLRHLLEEGLDTPTPVGDVRGLDDDLEDLRTAFTVQSVQEGLAGDEGGAKTAMEQGRTDIANRCVTINDWMEDLDEAAEYATLLGHIPTVIEWLNELTEAQSATGDADVNPNVAVSTVIAAVVAIEAKLQAIALTIHGAGATVGLYGLWRIRRRHGGAINGVQAGDPDPGVVGGADPHAELVQAHLGGLTPDGTAPSVEHAAAIDLLETFRSALAEDDYAAARNALVDLSEQYEDLEATERQLERRAAALRRVGDVSPAERAVIEEHLQTASAATFQRNGLLMAGVAIFLAGSEPDQSTVDELDAAASALESQESNLQDTATAVHQTTEGATLPPQLSLAPVATPGALARGDEAPLTLELVNVGDAPAEATTLQGTVPDGLTIDPTTVDLGSIDGEAGTQVTVHVTGTAPGMHTATFTVNSSTGGTDSTQVDVRVEGTDEPGLVKYANEDGIIDTPGLLDAIADWRSDVIETTLLLDVIDAWRSGEPVV